MEELKRKLETDIKLLSDEIKELKKEMDKQYNIKLDALLECDYDKERNARVNYEIANDRMNLLTGRMFAKEEVLKELRDIEEAEKLEMEYSDYLYYKNVGAYELPF